MYGNDRGFRNQRSFAPVKVGDELTVKIEAVGEKGDGIAKKDGFVLFVPNTNQGEEVKIKVTKVLRKVGFAEVVERPGNKKSKTAREDEEESYGEDESDTEDAEEASDSDSAEASEDDSAKDSEDFGEEES